MWGSSTPQEKTEAQKLADAKKEMATLEGMLKECMQAVQPISKGISDRPFQMKKDYEKLQTEINAAITGKIFTPTSRQCQESLDDMVRRFTKYSDDIKKNLYPLVDDASAGVADIQKDLKPFAVQKNLLIRALKDNMLDMLDWLNPAKGKPAVRNTSNNQTNNNTDQAKETSDDSTNNAEEVKETSDDSTNNAEKVKETSDDSTNNAEEVKENVDDSTNNAEEVKETSDDSANNAEEVKENVDDSTNNAEEVKDTVDDSTNNAEEVKEISDDSTNNAEEVKETNDDSTNNAEELKETVDDSANNAKQAKEPSDDSSDNAEKVNETVDDSTNNADQPPQPNGDTTNNSDPGRLPDELFHDGGMVEMLDASSSEFTSVTGSIGSTSGSSEPPSPTKTPYKHEPCATPRECCDKIGEIIQNIESINAKMTNFTQDRIVTLRTNMRIKIQDVSDIVDQPYSIRIPVVYPDDVKAEFDGYGQRFKSIGQSINAKLIEDAKALGVKLEALQQKIVSFQEDTML